MAARRNAVKNTFTAQRIRYRLYVVFLFIFSASFLLMYFGMGADGMLNPWNIIAGACFWIGLIGTIFSAISINSMRRADMEFQESHADIKRIGIIHFFTNKPAIIADTLMMISLIGYIIMRLLKSYNILSYILIAIFVFTFGMHCMLNGINYIYINDSRSKRRERTL